MFIYLFYNNRKKTMFYQIKKHKTLTKNQKIAIHAFWNCMTTKKCIVVLEISEPPEFDDYFNRE